MGIARSAGRAFARVAPASWRPKRKPEWHENNDRITNLHVVKGKEKYDLLVDSKSDNEHNVYVAARNEKTQKTKYNYAESIGNYSRINTGNPQAKTQSTNPMSGKSKGRTYSGFDSVVAHLEAQGFDVHGLNKGPTHNPKYGKAPAPILQGRIVHPTSRHNTTYTENRYENYIPLKSKSNEYKEWSKLYPKKDTPPPDTLITPIAPVDKPKSPMDILSNWSKKQRETNAPLPNDRPMYDQFEGKKHTPGPKPSQNKSGARSIQDSFDESGFSANVRDYLNPPQKTLKKESVSKSSPRTLQDNFDDAGFELNVRNYLDPAQLPQNEISAKSKSTRAVKPPKEPTVKKNAPVPVELPANATVGPLTKQERIDLLREFNQKRKDNRFTAGVAKEHVRGSLNPPVPSPDTVARAASAKLPDLNDLSIDPSTLTEKQKSEFGNSLAARAFANKNTTQVSAGLGIPSKNLIDDVNTYQNKKFDIKWDGGTKEPVLEGDIRREGADVIAKKLRRLNNHENNPALAKTVAYLGNISGNFKGQKEALASGNKEGKAKAQRLSQDLSNAADLTGSIDASKTYDPMTGKNVITAFRNSVNTGVMDKFSNGKLRNADILKSFDTSTGQFNFINDPEKPARTDTQRADNVSGIGLKTFDEPSPYQDNNGNLRSRTEQAAPWRERDRGHFDRKTGSDVGIVLPPNPNEFQDYKGELQDDFSFDSYLKGNNPPVRRGEQEIPDAVPSPTQDEYNAQTGKSPETHAMDQLHSSIATRLAGIAGVQESNNFLANDFAPASPGLINQSTDSDGKTVSDAPKIYTDAVAKARLHNAEEDVYGSEDKRYKQAMQGLSGTFDQESLSYLNGLSKTERAKAIEGLVEQHLNDTVRRHASNFANPDQDTSGETNVFRTNNKYGDKFQDNQLPLNLIAEADRLGSMTKAIDNHLSGDPAAQNIAKKISEFDTANLQHQKSFHEAALMEDFKSPLNQNLASTAYNYANQQGIPTGNFSPFVAQGKPVPQQSTPEAYVQTEPVPVDVPKAAMRSGLARRGKQPVVEQAAPEPPPQEDIGNRVENYFNPRSVGDYFEQSQFDMDVRDRLNPPQSAQESARVALNAPTDAAPSQAEEPQAPPPPTKMTKAEIDGSISVLMHAPSSPGGKPRVSFKTQREEREFRRGFEAANEKPGALPPTQQPGVPAKEQKYMDAWYQGWSHAQLKLSVNATTPPQASVIDQVNSHIAPASDPVSVNLDKVKRGKRTRNAEALATTRILQAITLGDVPPIKLISQVKNRDRKAGDYDGYEYHSGWDDIYSTDQGDTPDNVLKALKANGIVEEETTVSDMWNIIRNEIGSYRNYHTNIKAKALSDKQENNLLNEVMKPKDSSKTVLVHASTMKIGDKYGDNLTVRDISEDGYVLIDGGKRYGTFEIKPDQVINYTPPKRKKPVRSSLPDAPF